MTWSLIILSTVFAVLVNLANCSDGVGVVPQNTRPNNNNNSNNNGSNNRQRKQYLASAPSQQAAGQAGGGTRERKPNIILILTDDQDVELGSLNFMPKTLKGIRDKGAQFRHAYVTTPMCCPSRSSLLTGMYVHNHHVYTNNDNCSSTNWQATYETRSFATYLSNAGYRTGYFGKYLNKYNGSYIPPGWREWGGLIKNSKYYNYSINMNGKKIKHGFDYHKDYYPDLIANDSIAFLRQSKKNNQHKPVMLTMSFPAPHGPEDSAPQYSHLFFNVTTHHTPSYDYAPNPDKQWILQITKKMEPIHREFTDLLMTKRLQTLQSVDDAVGRIVAELESLGELDNTYIVYTSDHGYHLGQFGLIKGKSFPFEFDVRVPFLVRGPGVEAGSVVDDIVLNIDLAPTFLDMAGVEPPPHMDGRSVLPLFLNTKRKRVRWPDTFLIESSGRRETPHLDKMRLNKYTTMAPTEAPKYSTFESTTSGLSTPAPPKIYESGEDVDIDDDDGMEIDDSEDDLDDSDDPILEPVIEDNSNEDLQSAVTNKATLVPEIQLDNRVLPSLPLASNKFQRLAVECLQENMMLPCKSGQIWYCQKEDGRFRKHKCKSLNMQRTIPTSTERYFKKCACFTAQGVVYKKIPNVAKRETTKLRRLRRDTDLDEILFERLDEHRINNLSHRQKRDALEHVEHVMKSVRGQLNGLKTANESASLLEGPSIKTNLETNVITYNIPPCIVERGRVNCSKAIFHDKKTWRKSRHQLDNEIHQLRQKLETLKEIRRHLKHTRPSGDVDDFNNKTNNLDIADFNSLNARPNFNIDPLPPAVSTTTTTERNKRKRKRPQEKPSRPFGGNFTEIEESYSTSESGGLNYTEITTSAPAGHTNHHRHGHQKITTEEPRRRTTQKSKIEEGVHPNKMQDLCHCEDTEDPISQRELARREKQRLKEEQLMRKLRKQRKRLQQEKECGSERMNCFHHDNDHWKTAPLWTSGPFCFCMNANNNTYSCVRTINATHNFLYCEFTTGLVTFYNLRRDPFELQNSIDQLKPEERSYLHDILKQLIACKGRGCTVNHHHHSNAPSQKSRTNLLPVNLPLTQHHQQQQARFKKRKLADEARTDVRGVEGRSGKQHIYKVDMRGRNRNFTTSISKSALLARRQTGII